jgi:hypothetical protein
MLCNAGASATGKSNLIAIAQARAGAGLQKIVTAGFLSSGAAGQCATVTIQQPKPSAALAWMPFAALGCFSRLNPSAPELAGFAIPPPRLPARRS